ncbi:CDP-glycerol glycerophosphotransferase family protein [Lachnospiraceae bacterium OttesenSCG-928-D06]|nr:CDP-glycerol glycerophosphotransferase family protein [Lachnospiraceae bacterium OttesenSCG-928-D06]
MHIKKKEQINKMLQTFREMHAEIFDTQGGEGRQLVLEKCQQIAILVGNIIESEMNYDVTMILLLECYCEEIFEISKASVLLKEHKFKIDGIIFQLEEKIRKDSSVYHIVFLPYKAEMWDSMESVWLAAKRDMSCRCFVMPIPYFKLDNNEKQYEMCYEGDMFPSDVDIIDYREYSLEEIMPDIAYIHNPYDAGNFVTSVHPNFYSSKIKNKVGILVYIPYYVTTGRLPEGHMTLPAYVHSDYIVLQSDYTKNTCERMFYYDKILPLGSPKFDRVIKVCKQGGSIPPEWEKILQGKKAVMLNTSIGCFLQQGNVYIAKIRKIFDTISKDDRIVIIWRPHPLLRTTMQSLRPHLIKSYNELKKYFIDNDMGIFDETIDITNIVAISDGYIGESESSIINLFGVAGKPIFILDNSIVEEFSEEDKRKVLITDAVRRGGEIWMIGLRPSILMRLDIATKRITNEGFVKAETKWSSAYTFMGIVGDNIFLSPEYADSPALYNVNVKRMINLIEGGLEQNLHLRQVVVSNQKIFFLPGSYGGILEIDLDTNKMKVYKSCISEIKKGKAHIVEEIYDYAIMAGDLWLTATYTNQILQFSMKDGTYIIHKIGREDYSYSGIVREGNGFWLAEVNTGNIIYWIPYKEEYVTYYPPKGFECWNKVAARNLAHMHLYKMGNWIVSVPYYSNCIMRINIETKEIALVAEEFMKAVDKPHNGYNPQLHSAIQFAYQENENIIWIQRRYDAAVAILNVKEDSYEMFYPTIQEEYIELIKKEDGFEKLGEEAVFFRKESKFFSLEEFVGDLVEERLDGVRKKQFDGLARLATNMDGTCGEKVHEYMIEVMGRKH